MSTELNITNLFVEARKIAESKRKKEQESKTGNLRAGNSGIMSSSGLVAGSCIRKAHLRQLEIETEVFTEDKLLMFDLGFASEDIILGKLEHFLEGKYKVLSEDAIPTSWKTQNGTVVSGRPDHVVCTTEGEPVLGLELKSVHSMWTARDVHFGGKPKLSNIIQAAHYMWQLGIPYKLIYSSYSSLGQGMSGASSGWILKMLPAPGEPNSEHISYTYYRKEFSPKVGREIDKKCTEEEWKATSKHNRSYSIKELKQKQTVYDLRLKDDYVQYKLEQDTEWKDTVVRVSDIQRYFDFASRISTDKQLGPRPEEIETDGKKANFSVCDYCPLQKTCDKYESQGYDKWLQAVRDYSKVSVK